MLVDVARFEVRYQFRNPVFWVAVGLFFLLGFGLTASENVGFGSPGAVHENSPYTVGIALAVFAIFYQFVTTSFVANSIVRDDTTGFGPIIRSTPLTKLPLVLGRFLGGLIIATLGYFATPLGMMTGAAMPWVDAETVGPNGITMYAWQFAVVALPNIFLSCALLLALATTFRSMLASYVGVVVLLMGYTVTLVLSGDNPDWLEWLARFEFLGIAAIQDLTRYWTTAELNTRLFQLEGNFLFNRLFVLAVGLGLLAATCWRFSLSERAPSRRTLRKIAKKEARVAARTTAPPTLEYVPGDPVFNPATTRAQFGARLKTEIGQVLKSPGLIVILLLCMFNALADLWTAQSAYGTSAYPLTANVIDSLRNGYPFFLLMIGVFYGGELVWRERDRRINEILDSTPVADWVMVVPKVLAILLVLLLVNASGVVAGLATQAIKGAGDTSLTKYVAWFLLPGTIDALLIAMLAVFFQVLSPNKYVGWGLMLLWFIASVFLGNLGYDNILYSYASTPFEPLSDMNGTGGFWVGGLWGRAYWIAIAALLLIAAHLVWPRGTVTALRPRLANARSRLGKAEIGFAAVALALAVGSGSVVFHNIKQLNVYRTSDEQEERAADFERLYLKYETLPQPSVRRVKLHIQIFPEERKFETSGIYSLANMTDSPLNEVHLRVATEDVMWARLSVDGARRVKSDLRHGYYIFRFDKPMKPGAVTMARFASRIWHRGFRNGNQATDVTPNGVFVNNFNFAPVVGMDRYGLLSDRTQRRRQGLSSELRPAKLEDETATQRNYIGTDWVLSDITVSTDADQTPVAPGDRISDNTANGRRTARFVSNAPIHNFFSVQSARYAVDRRMNGKVASEVYYHPGHAWNIPVMQKAIAESLAYYQANFGPYQFHYARVLEFPGYNSFAQAFAGTIPYSESIGFAADVRDPSDIDYVTYVTAHEMAHQWWAHQVVGADMQGATLTSETLAQYSALMVMKRIYGPDSIRRFLKYELDSYLAQRKTEAIEEVPLGRVENQAYIHYNKGALAMYLLQERLGEASVNRALRAFVERWRFKGPPYHRSVDLISEFRKVARTPEQQALITDLFERIAVYDLKTTAAQTRHAKDVWETVITVVAQKYYADGKGEEVEAKLDEAIEIGLFTARPGEGAFNRADVISITRHPVRNGAQKVVIQSKTRPAYAGIDPYNYYVDRNGDDNVMAVTQIP